MTYKVIGKNCITGIVISSAYTTTLKEARRIKNHWIRTIPGVQIYIRRIK